MFQDDVIRFPADFVESKLWSAKSLIFEKCYHETSNIETFYSNRCWGSPNENNGRLVRCLWRWHHPWHPPEFEFTQIPFQIGCSLSHHRCTWRSDEFPLKIHDQRGIFVREFRWLDGKWNQQSVHHNRKEQHQSLSSFYFPLPNQSVYLRIKTNSKYFVVDKSKEILSSAIQLFCNFIWLTWNK